LALGNKREVVHPGEEFTQDISGNGTWTPTQNKSSFEKTELFL